MNEKWQQISRETLFDNPYYRISHDRYRRPDGEIGDYYYVDIPGSTMVVPALADGRLVLVRQYRYLMARPSLEFPAGGLPRGVDPLENAKRELREEAGYSAAHWHRLGAFAPYNGVSNEVCQVFLASELDEVPAAPEPTEEFEILSLSTEEIEQHIDRGELWDGMTVNSFYLYLRHRRAQA